MTDKVYHWQGFMDPGVGEKVGADSWNSQCYLLAYAPSKAACARLVGETPRRLFNLDETGNAEDIAIARAHPGIVLMSPMSGPHRRDYFFQDGTPVPPKDVTLDELVQTFVEWLATQPTVTEVDRVSPGSDALIIQTAFLGIEIVGFKLGGLPISVEFNHTP